MTAQPTDSPPMMRIAFRVEGPNWNAYLAPMGSMEGAVFLGSIKMTLVEASYAIKAAFKELMKDAMAVAIREVTGANIEGWTESRAPESERSGSA